MNILCIALVGNYTNYTLYNTDKKIIQYFCAERLIDYKKATFSLERILVNAKKIYKKIDLIIISPCDLGESFFDNDKQLYKKTSLKHINNFSKNVETYFIDHHYAHVLSSLALNNKINNGIAIDGAGCFSKRVSIFKNLNNIKNTEVFLNEKDMAIGAFFENSSQAAGIGEIGKMMGLQSYGKLEHTFYNKLEKIGINNEMIYTYFLEHELKNIKLEKNNCFDKVYTVHKFAIDKALEVFERNFSKNEPIAFGGGCGLSIPLNSLLLDKGYDITICPAANDSGISIGCLKFADLLLNLNIDFSNLVFSSGNCDVGYISDKNIKLAARLLADNQIIGWCQGAGEVGPRALGHRSFLMNPSIANGKDFINNEIKHREWWRPFGGTIIDTSVLENYIPSNLDSYMLRTFKFKKEWKEKFQSIIHVDNTTRLQILTNKKEPFYKLIEEFYKLTGIPGVLNTSYNLGGKPISNSKESIFNTFENSKICHLFIGDNYYSK